MNPKHSIRVPISEYLEYAKHFVFNFFKKNPPREWESRTKGDVLILPGFLGNWRSFRHIASALHQRGYGVHALNYNTTLSVEQLSKEAEAYIKSNHLKDISLIAHSKGGIIAKYLLDYHPEIEKKIKICITIATPWKGTERAKLKIFSLEELLPGSKLLQRIVSSAHCEKIFNLYPEVDHLIIPNENSYLPQSKNIKIPVDGHIKILDHSETVQIITDQVEKSGKNHH